MKKFLISDVNILLVEALGMSIYDKMEEAIHCRDLIESGCKLIDFSELASIENNRASLIKLFYERLYQRAFIDYAFSFLKDEKYLIYEGKSAVGSYLGLAIPPKSSPVKTLKNIKDFGHRIVNNFRKPIGERIRRDKIEEIMVYLDDKYDFTRKVFCEGKAIFLLLDVSHIDYNSECLVQYSQGKVIQHLILYHLHSAKSKFTPEAVFFHELGHTLHARVFGDVHSIPDGMVKFLKELCFPSIDMYTPKQQSEILADVLSIGMMYDSPYSQYDYFDDIHKDDKEVFRMLFEKMLTNIL